jgi:glycosyltransferase involved in cell wall biosynthesis
MRVILTVASLDPAFGGPVVNARALAGTLAGEGAEVLVAGGVPADGRGDSGAVGLTAPFRFHGTPLPVHLGPLRNALDQADIVHILGYRDPVGTAAALRARRRSIPYVLEPSGMLRRRLRSLSLKAIFDAGPGRAVIGGAARIVATSGLEARELTEDGIPPARVVVRPNGVDVEALLPGSARGRLRKILGIPTGAPVVLHLGRIAAKKGLLDLVRAIATVPAVHGIVAGPDDGDGTLGQLFQLRSVPGLRARMHILPRGYWGDEKAELLADADCFALPSATENFGNAAAEAAVCGLPVIVSNRCGVAEFLAPEASRIVQYRDIDGLSGAINWALSRDAGTAARAAAARVRERLDWKVLARDQLGVYRQVLGEDA